MEQRWLHSCRSDILNSQDWQVVKHELLRRLASEVEARGVGHLSALSEQEKMLLLLQVQPSIMAEPFYKNLLATTSKLVGRHLLDDVNRTYDGGRRQHPEGSSPPVHEAAPKATMIVDQASTGAASLLARWPSTKAACGPLINSAHVPDKLRRGLWRAWLGRPLVSAHFRANPPSKTLSMQYQLVSQTTAAVLGGTNSNATIEVVRLPMGPTPTVAVALASCLQGYTAEQHQARLQTCRKLLSYHVALEESKV